MKPARYLFLGHLVQDSSSSFGGQNGENWVDQPFCRDGQGRHTLRGEGQAGALLAMARKLFKRVPRSLGGDDKRLPSAWRTYTTHPCRPPASELRQCVRINPKTAAAEDGALFDLETLPPEVCWPFLLELDLGLPDEAENGAMLAVTVRVLRAWSDGYAWLGRGVARGLGWFTLNQPRVLALTETDNWPDSFRDDPFKYAEELAAGRSKELDTFIEEQKSTGGIIILPDGDWRWRSYNLTLRFGVFAQSDYDGLGALSIGSHAGYDAKPPYPGDEFLLRPTGLKDFSSSHWIPDRFVATTGAKLLPYIPGSAIRGPLRHRLAWWLNRQGGDESALEAFGKLFGYVKKATEGEEKTDARSSALLIRDAFPTSSDSWRMALLPSHAEDEFAGGVYGNALYNRLAVLDAAFTTRVVLEAPRDDDLGKLEKLFKQAQRLASLGFVTVGGASRHGFGHGHWEFEPAPGLRDERETMR